MVWAKIDDAILDNPKIASAGFFGFAFHVAAITWCCRNLTDGFIPRSRVSCLLSLGDSLGELLGTTRSVPAAIDGVIHSAMNLGAFDCDLVAKRNVACGLWREDSELDGYWLNDFLVYNLSREEVERKRELERKKKASNRRSCPPPTKDSLGVSHGVSLRESPGDTMSDDLRESQSCPVGILQSPVPVPLKTETKIADVGRPTVKRARAEPTGDHAELIRAYIAEFEQLRGCKPVIDAKCGAGAKKLLNGRTVDEAIAIVQRAFADPFIAQNKPDLASIAGNVNAYIGKDPASGTHRVGTNGRLPFAVQPPAKPGEYNWRDKLKAAGEEPQ